MLGRMIMAGHSLLRRGRPDGPADYFVSNDAEWDAVFANSASTLANKVVEIVGSNFTQRTIANKDIAAAGGRLTIRSANALASLPSLMLTGTVRGIDFYALNFQMTGWPQNYASCFSLGSGTFGKLRFLNGTKFRHGYGPSLTNLDTAAELPEYQRIDNVRTASTASQTFALTWKDPAAPTGWIEFFNRGAQPIYVAIGGPGVVATTASQACAAGSKIRIGSLDPDVHTHCAVLAAAGTSTVNARTEIGLTEYLAPAFTQSGSATLEDIELRGCVFRDLATGAKGMRPTRDSVIMDCDFDRIYMDIIALPPQPGASLYVLRNLESLPFARSGIAEDLQGDARDPHGDQFQAFGQNTGTIGPIYYAGNRIRVRPLRSGVQSQGVFVSDNDFDPCYSGLFFISTMQVGGSSNALYLGEAGTAFKIRDAFVYGASIVNWRGAALNGPALTVDQDDDGTTYVGKSIAPALNISDRPYQQDGNFALAAAVDRSAVFPNLASLSTAVTRADIEAAMTTAAEGAGLGAAATSNAIDWETEQHTEVILWQNLPSGAHWNALTQQEPASLVTLPLRKILNRRPNQTVTIAPGTEWRSLAADAVTQIQDWNGNPGTIAPDQFIQIRRTTAPSGQSVSAEVTINGFTQRVPITSSAVPVTYLVMPTTTGYFTDPVNVPPGISRITFRGDFRFPSIINAMKPFAQVSTGCDLIFLSNGGVNVTAEDGVGTAVLLNQPLVPAGGIMTNTWYNLVFDVDHVTRIARLIVNGAPYEAPFTAIGNGTFQSTRALSLLATATGGNALAAGTLVANLSVDYNGIPFKTIANSAATANADLWRKGGAFTNI